MGPRGLKVTSDWVRVLMAKLFRSVLSSARVVMEKDLPHPSAHRRTVSFGTT